MDELIERIASEVGISGGLATNALAIILSFLEASAPAEAVDTLMEALPGTKDLIRATADDEAADPGAGGLMGNVMSAAGGLIGGSAGGAIAALTKLQAAGLDLAQVQGVISAFIAFAREKTGDEAVDEVVQSIPGLEQLL